MPRGTVSVLGRAAVAPLALLVVLASHVSLRWSSDLTPWKGGGFGMFSTVDSPASRVIRVELETDTGVVPVAIPSGLRDLASEVRTAPSRGRLVRLAEALARQWWVVPELISRTGSDPLEDATLRELAVEALSQVVPVEAVQAVEPHRFDESVHRRLEVRGVTVAVFRLDTETRGGDRPGTVLRARPIRMVSLDLAARAGEASS